MKIRVDTTKIHDEELFNLTAAAELAGVSRRTLANARSDGRLLTLRTNPKLVTGRQLICYLEDPLRIKSMRS